jgi:transcriptional regulator with XRE-family HTH domain
MASKQKTPKWLDNLRSRMVAMGFNPRSLSLKAGLNATAVRDMLEGRTKFPRYDTVLSLSKALDLSPAQLMGEKTANQNASFSEDLDLLVEIISRLQEEATSLGHELPPKDFAAMTATIFRQMKQSEGELQPKVRDLLAYENLKSRAAK